MLLDALHAGFAMVACRLLQGCGHRGQGVLQPASGFLLQGLRLSIVLQAQGPLLEAGAGCQGMERLTLLQALIGQAQLLQEDAPGDGVNQQVVTEQQQAPGLSPRQVEEHSPRQRPFSQVQAGLHLITALLHATGLLLFR